VSGLDLLVAVPDGSAFRFDVGAIADAARRRWPETEEVVPPGELAQQVDRYVYVPSGEPRRYELAPLLGGRGLSIEGPDGTDAAELLAWVAEVTAPPAEAGAVLMNWSADVVPFTADLTAEELRRLR
jgi:hypothetical protein